jgi:hypothetical protein
MLRAPRRERSLSACTGSSSVPPNAEAARPAVAKFCDKSHRLSSAHAPPAPRPEVAARPLPWHWLHSGDLHSHQQQLRPRSMAMTIHVAMSLWLRRWRYRAVDRLIELCAYSRSTPSK